MLRLFDANFNRCREGLRVIEDILRFSLNLPLFQELKTMRHTLKEIEESLGSLKLAFRDVGNDLGKNSFLQEKERKNLKDLLLANFKRVEESLRVLEEVLKLDFSNQAFTIKNLRYQAYDLEQKVLALLSRSFNLSLYLVTDSRHNSLPLEKVVEEGIKGGVSIVQLREKHLPDAEIYKLGKKVLKVCSLYQVPLIIDDRADLCLALDAHGVHIGQKDIPVKAVRKILGPFKIIGKSTHSLKQAQQAVQEDIDYFAFGPLFATPTKDYTPVGLEYIQEIKDLSLKSQKPVVFIGGITEQTLPLLSSYQLGAVAVVREIMASSNPQKSAKNICQTLML